MEDVLDLGNGMLGLLSRPPTGARNTAAVLFNAGIMPRTGPFRVTVQLARTLALAGHPTLRFDLPGIGDSIEHARRAPVDIVSEVLDRLQAHSGCSHFVVGGICSAADLGWRVALNDARVTGVLMYDGLARKGTWFRIARINRSLRTPLSTWPARIARQLRPRPVAVNTPDQLRDWPAPGQEREQLKQLVERGVRLFMLYTGGTSYFLHPRQFRATFGAAADSDAVEFQYWPDCDHLFFAEHHRQRLLAETADWLSRGFA